MAYVKKHTQSVPVELSVIVNAVIVEDEHRRLYRHRSAPHNTHAYTHLYTNTFKNNASSSIQLMYNQKIITLIYL